MAALIELLLANAGVIVSRFCQILLFTAIMKPLSHFASVCWTWVYLTRIRLYKPAALKMAQSVMAASFDVDADWGRFVADYVNKFAGANIDPEQIVQGGMGRSQAAVMQVLGEKFLKPMLSVTLPSPSEVERDPLLAANRFMGLSLEMNMSGWMLHLLSDMFSWGQFKALGELPNAISRSFGMARLARFVLGPAFKVAIVDPMTKLFNQIYVPEGYTVTQAMQLARSSTITYEEYIKVCLNNGIAPQKAANLYDLGEKELTDSWMARLVKMGWLKEDEIAAELTRRGFTESRAVLLARFIRDDRKLDIIDKIIDAAGDLYKDGTLDRTRLEGYLSKAAYTREEIDLLLIQLDLQRSRRQFLTPAQVTSLLKLKKLGRAEAKAYLTDKLNFTAGDAELYMQLRETAA